MNHSHVSTTVALATAWILCLPSAAATAQPVDLSFRELEDSGFKIETSGMLLAVLVAGAMGFLVV